MKLTHEQEAILAAYKQSTGHILAKAYAGATKTTTLVLLTEANPQLQFLYVAYNRKIVEEAKGRFPKNVTIKTAYSLAYNAMRMSRYSHKLNRTRRFNYSKVIFEDSQVLIPSIPNLSQNQIIQLLRETIGSFERSADTRISTEGIKRKYELVIQAMVVISETPKLQLLKSKDQMIRRLQGIGEPEAEEKVDSLLQLCQRLEVDKRSSHFTSLSGIGFNVLKILNDLFANELVGASTREFFAWLGTGASRLWTRMLDVESPVPIDHSTYLKMYQLSRPNLSGYDCILVDEYQDANPVIADIVEQQSQRKVYVGDTHQSIYGFTGAVNSIETMEAKGIPCYPLTKSFRFGRHIASIADRVLALKYRYHPDKFAEGSILPVEGVGELSHSGADGRATLLCRTNAGVVEAALSLITRGVTDLYIGESISPAFLSDLKDIQRLISAERPLIENPYIKDFSSLKEFQSECKLTGNVDYLRGISIIRKMKGNPDVLGTIDRLLGLSNSSPDSAKFAIITAHKAKGCEWPNVEIASDFEEKFFKDDGSLLDEVPMEEINLLYVAVTRARRSISYPKKFQAYFEN